jgi:hypothetical protein
MRDPERIDRILRQLRIIWTAYPDMRFLQLIECIVTIRANGGTGKPALADSMTDTFYIEDDEFEIAIRKFMLDGND